jgi:hypothetical protein
MESVVEASFIWQYYTVVNITVVAMLTCIFEKMLECRVMAGLL